MDSRNETSHRTIGSNANLKAKSYSCDICGKSFVLKSSLRTHVIKHNPKVPYDCYICGRVFKEKSDFKKHLEVHSSDDNCVANLNEIEYKVNVSSTELPPCQTDFGRKLGQSEEYSTSSNSNSDTLVHEDLFSSHQNCDEILSGGTGGAKSNLADFSSKESSNRLKKIVSVCSNQLCCSVCKATFSSDELYERHINAEFNECEKCDKFYSSCLSLKMHMKSHSLSFECKVCLKNFSTKQYLRRHELSHMEHEACPLCEKKCKNKRILRLHMNRMHGSSSSVKCKECGEEFKRHEIQEHKLTHKKHDTHQCEKCGLSFSELYRLKNHMKIHKHNKDAWECVICGKTLSTKHALEGHSLTHTGEQECNICGVKLSNESCLKRHVSSFHGEKDVVKKSERRVQCDICGNMYGKSYIETHLKIHAGRKDFHCSECGKDFVSQTNLREHQNVHRLEKKYKCSSCDKVFATRKSLVTHTRKHTGETPYKCSVCMKTFVTVWTLKNHLRLHDVEKAFSCEICSKKFGQKKSLYAHYAGDSHTHEELQCLDPKILNSISKKYQCVLCGKNCYEKTMLTIHMRTHTGEKPFKCTECGKAFRVESLLKAHKKYHTGKSLFECAVCKKPFAHRSQAVRHETLHNREKPHLCTICGKTFFTKSSLKIHMERHSFKNVYACGTCGEEFTIKKKCLAHQKACLFGTGVTSQMSDSCSLDSSYIVDHNVTVNVISPRDCDESKELNEQENPSRFENCGQSIECLEYLFDFDVESSKSQVTFNLSEDANSIKEDLIVKEELVVLEIDHLDFQVKANGC